MAKQRIVNTRFWIDDYISNLDPVEKLLFLYFLTNPYTDICGVYEIPLKHVALETGLDKEMVIKILNRFKKDKKIFYKNGWVAIRNFAKHQQDNPKIKKGIELGLSKAPKELVDSLSIDYDELSHSNLNSNLNSNPNEAVASTAKGNKKTFNPLGGEIIKAFIEIDPKNKSYYSNKTQRAACDFLLEEYGLEDVLNRIKILPQLNKMPYFPSIYTPWDLKEKWKKLEEAVGREQFKLKANERKVII